MTSAAPNRATTNARFAKKRETILAAAQEVLAQQGVRGMTLAQVAAKVGLNAPAITYYFKKKEDLAAACMLAGIERLDVIMSEAARAGDEEQRLKAVFESFFARHRGVRVGGESPVAPLGEMNTLDEPHAGAVRAAFREMFRKARALFDGPRFTQHSMRQKTALAHLLLEQIFWTTGWLNRYGVEDYPRLLERATDIYLRGLAAPGSTWRGELAPLPAIERNPGAETTPESFLVAATRLVNKLGYRGASVDRISAELNVTKGSFYHHNADKEQLAVACFERSLRHMHVMQQAALAQSGAHWRRLDCAVSTIIDFQMSEAGPLLRASVLTGLSDPARIHLREGLNRVFDRFAGMIADCAAEGAVRPVDQLIAAELLKVTINAAAEAQSWVRDISREEIVALYARPMLMGVFAH